MIGRVLSRILQWVRCTETVGDSTDDQDDDTESDFVPSQLDASVNEAHGMDTRLAQQEVADIQEQAAELEDQHPEE
jgi:hypothetical protein